MTALFALYPLFSITFLFSAVRRKFKISIPFVLMLSAGSVILGYLAGATILGVFYAALFASAATFPVILKREVKGSTEEHRAGEKALIEKVGQSKFEREKWSGIRQRVVDEMEQISKRYAFARTLVARTDEKAVLTDLSTTFGSTRWVLGLAFSTNLEKEKGEKGTWVPSFTSGWVTEEDWSKILNQTLTGFGSAANSDFRI